jgi:hypothetical protein
MLYEHVYIISCTNSETLVWQIYKYCVYDSSRTNRTRLKKHLHKTNVHQDLKAVFYSFGKEMDRIHVCQFRKYVTFTSSFNAYEDMHMNDQWRSRAEERRRIVEMSTQKYIQTEGTHVTSRHHHSSGFR